MNQKVLICPHCCEANALEDRVCFACYCALDKSSIGTEVESRRLVEKKGLALQPRVTPKTPVRIAKDVFPFALVGLAFSSGWLPRRWRVPVLALSAAILGALCAHASWYNARHALPEREQESIASHSVGLMFRYVHESHAGPFHIEVGPRIVDVFYAIEGQYYSRMKIPLKLWPEVREEIYRHVRAGQTRIEPVENGKSEKAVIVQVSAQVELNQGGETMILNLVEVD